MHRYRSAGAENLRSKVLNRAAQAVVATGTALGTQPQSPERKVHVVHQNEQLLRCEAIPIEGSTNGATAVIHIGLRHQQPETLIPYPCFSSETMEFGLLTEAKSFGFGHPLQGHETDVVAGPRVFVAGVPQTNNQSQPFSHGRSGLGLGRVSLFVLRSRQ